MNKVNYLRLKKRLIKNSQFNLELEHNLSTFGQTIQSRYAVNGFIIYTTYVHGDS